MSEPKTIAIPEAAQQEMTALHAEVVAAVENFNTKREAFTQFVLMTKKTLGVPFDEPWDLTQDGSAFVQIEQPVIQQTVLEPVIAEPVAPENVAESIASVTPEAADVQEQGGNLVPSQKEHDPDPGDCH